MLSDFCVRISRIEFHNIVHLFKHFSGLQTLVNRYRWHRIIALSTKRNQSRCESLLSINVSPLSLFLTFTQNTILYLITLTSYDEEQQDTQRPNVHTFPIIVSVTKQLRCSVRWGTTKRSQFAMVRITRAETKVTNLQINRKKTLL